MRSAATRVERILPIVILLVAIFLRLYELGTLPTGLTHDEAENGVDALRIIDGQRPIFLTENNGREALFTYLQAISVTILGRTSLALRAVSAVIGVLTVVAAYLLVRRMFSARIALLSCGWLSISLWHVIFSRVGLRAILLPLFLAVGFYFIWRGLEAINTQAAARSDSTTTANRPRAVIWFALGGIVLGLSLYTYSAARFAPFVVLALGLYLALLHRQVLRQALLGLALALALTILVFLPQGLFFLNHPDSFLERAQEVWIFNAELHEGNPGQALFQSTLRTLGMFAIRGDSYWGHNISDWPIFDPLSALLMLTGAALAVRRFREPAYGFIIIWILVILAPMFIALDTPNHLRSTALIPAIFVLPALGVAWLWEAWESRSFVRQSEASGMLRALPIFVVTLALLGGAVHTYHSYFGIWVNGPRIAEYFNASQFMPPSVVCRMVRAEKGIQAEPELPLPARFGEQVFVHGFDLPRSVRAGETITVRWHWQILSESERKFAFTNQLFGEDDLRYGQFDERCFVPDDWPVGTSGVSTFEIQVDSETPTGAYRLVAAIYDRGKDGSNLPVFDAQGREAGSQLTLGPIKVHGRLSAPAPAIENRLLASFGDEINLLGYGLSDRTLTPGESLDLTLYWAPRGRPSRDYTVFVHLLDNEGQIQGQADSPPRAGKYPTSVWDAGEVIADLHTISLPADLPAGEYQVAVGLYDPMTGQRVGVAGENGRIVGDQVTISGLAVGG